MATTNIERIKKLEQILDKDGIEKCLAEAENFIEELVCNKKFVIFEDKIPERTDSFFYDGEIAIAEHKGKEFMLIATGDIKIVLPDEDDIIHNGNKWEKIAEYDLTDRKISKLEEEGKLQWENNNWFEVLYKNTDEDTWDFDIDEVAYDYDNAIELLCDKISMHEEGDLDGDTGR